jgi:hypothetical protein
MHARVATFEGAEAGKQRETVDQIREMAATGPPEGVNGKSFRILISPEEGKTLAIGLFETEADMKQAHEVLEAMEPPIPGGLGKRTSVVMYEVALDVEA